MTPDIEVYHYARGPAQNLEVLSWGFDPETKMNTQPARMRCAGLQTVMVRALQWLAGRPANFPVPPDFPMADKVSVRGEIPLRAPVVRR